MGNCIKINQLSECKTGENICINAVLNSMREVDTTGRTYSQTFLTIEDLTGRTKFPVWVSQENIEKDIWVGGIATFIGTVNEYNGEKQLKFESLKLLSEEKRKEIDPNYYKKVTLEQEKFFRAVVEQGFSDERYKRLCEVAFGLGEVAKGVGEEEYRGRLTKFKESFCSINHHDNYPGGLFNHTMGVVRVCLAVRKQYRKPVARAEKKSTINWEHLLALSLLHDYSKQRDYTVDEENPRVCRFSDEVRLDHNIEGATALVLLNNEVEEELRLSQKELEDLRYGILCHAGQWGNFEPITNEDKMFHCFDMIDSLNVDCLAIE